MNNTWKILLAEFEGKRNFRRPMHKWEDNTDINFKKDVFVMKYRLISFRKDQKRTVTKTESGPFLN